MTLGTNLTSIGVEAFLSCTSLMDITVAGNNTAYSSVNGVLFDKAQTTLILFPAGRSGSYFIPDGVTSIGSYAFSYCANLASVTIPASVSYVQQGAFISCTNLTNLTFLGNAPNAGDSFYDLGAGATVYYYYGTTGWSPTSFGLPTVMLGAPALQIGAGITGVKPGGFGFSVSGVVNQTIVVEASTNLTTWQPIWTSTLSDVSTDFVDPDWLNHPRRFYRARSY